MTVDGALDIAGITNGLSPLGRGPLGVQQLRAGDADPVNDDERAQWLDRQQRFASVLSTEQRRAGEKGTPEEQARQAAESLVSIAFVQPLLSEMREGTWAAPPFQPTQGEKQFRALGDAATAQELVHASHWALVDRIATDIGKRGVEVTA